MDWGAIITGLAASAVTLAGAWLVSRTSKRTQDVEEKKVDTTAADAFLKGQVAFQEYTDKLVREKVAEALAPMQTELGELRELVETMKTESHEMNDAVRARETQLWLWNLRGRSGLMPMLPDPLLQRLGLAHLINTTGPVPTES